MEKLMIDIEESNQTLQKVIHCEEKQRCSQPRISPIAEFSPKLKYYI